jgi:hypothetical protein
MMPVKLDQGTEPVVAFTPTSPPCVPEMSRVNEPPNTCSNGWHLWTSGGGQIEAGAAADHHLAGDDAGRTLETTRTHRVAGLTGDRPALVTTRRCRAPHQTISEVGLIGGGPLAAAGGRVTGAPWRALSR